jgi:hypothetical protein
MPTPFRPRDFFDDPHEFGVVLQAAWKRGLEAVPAPWLASARCQHLVVCQVNRKLGAVRSLSLGDLDIFVRDRRAASTFAARLLRTAEAPAGEAGWPPVDTTALRKKLHGQATFTLDDVLAWASVLGTDILTEVVSTDSLLPPDRRQRAG